MKILYKQRRVEKSIKLNFFIRSLFFKNIDFENLTYIDDI